jgi:hypothetical protein
VISQRESYLVRCLFVVWIFSHFFFSLSVFVFFREPRQNTNKSGCKLQTKPKAKWTQSSMTLHWQLRKIDPRSKIYLNAIYTLPPEVIVDGALISKLKHKPAVSVQFHLEEGSGSQQAQQGLHDGRRVIPTGTSIEIAPAKRGITNLRTVNKRRLSCRYNLTYTSQ